MALVVTWLVSCCVYSLQLYLKAVCYNQTYHDTNLDRRQQREKTLLSGRNQEQDQGRTGADEQMIKEGNRYVNTTDLRLQKLVFLPHLSIQAKKKIQR